MQNNNENEKIHRVMKGSYEVLFSRLYMDAEFGSEAQCVDAWKCSFWK